MSGTGGRRRGVGGLGQGGVDGRGQSLDGELQLIYLRLKVRSFQFDGGSTALSGSEVVGGDDRRGNLIVNILNDGDGVCEGSGVPGGVFLIALVQKTFEDLKVHV